MARKQKASFKPLRWSLSQAASEFGLSPKTIAQRVKAAGALPGKDKKFSTVEIHSAICGDYERERTRKMKEEADGRALDNAAIRNRLVDKEDLLKRFEPIYVAMKQKVMQSAMSDAEKDGLLAELAKLHQV